MTSRTGAQAEVCLRGAGEGGAGPSWFTSFDAFAVERSPELLARARTLLHSDHLAQDVTAEVLGRIYAKWSTIRRLDAPDAYVRRMLLNECVSHWRRHSTRYEQSVDPTCLPDTSTADPSEQHARRDLIARALRTLSTQQQAVLVLRFYEHMSDIEIAHLLKIKEGTVRYHVSVGLARLRDVLGTTLKGDGSW